LLGCRQGHPDLRCFGSRREDENKSWSELAEEAADVAKAVVGKIIKTGQEIAKSGSKGGKEKLKRKEDEEGRLLRPGEMFGGLMGRTVGSLIGSVFRGLSEQLAETQRQTRDVYAEAADRVQKSEEIRSALGSVTCGAPFSQSSSSQSINGVITKRTALEFPVSGTRGSGMVQVDATEDADRIRNIRINVRLSSGRTIRVESDRSSEGRTIDVDWKDV